MTDPSSPARQANLAIASTLRTLSPAGWARADVDTALAAAGWPVHGDRFGTPYPEISGTIVDYSDDGYGRDAPEVTSLDLEAPDHTDAGSPLEELVDDLTPVLGPPASVCDASVLRWYLPAARLDVERSRYRTSTLQITLSALPYRENYDWWSIEWGPPSGTPYYWRADQVPLLPDGHMIMPGNGAESWYEIEFGLPEMFDSWRRSAIELPRTVGQVTWVFMAPDDRFVQGYFAANEFVVEVDRQPRTYANESARARATATDVVEVIKAWDVELEDLSSRVFASSGRLLTTPGLGIPAEQ